MGNVNENLRIDAYTMLIRRRSPTTGQINERTILITKSAWDKWCAGTVIQIAMSGLTPDEREFILTGMTPDDWRNTFGGDDEK